MHAYCTRCNAKLVPAMGGILKCPRINSCGRGGLLEGTQIEIVHANYVTSGVASA